MKKIQDYLPFYIGCKVCREHSDVRSKKFFEYGTLVGISASEVEKGRVVSIIDVGIDHFHEWYVEETKPILRQLNDMTEEEANEIWHMDEPLSILKMEVGTISRKVVLSPERTKYLLSKHFDLFGLIPEGLAIDSKTLK